MNASALIRMFARGLLEYAFNQIFNNGKPRNTTKNGIAFALALLITCIAWLISKGYLQG